MHTLLFVHREQLPVNHVSDELDLLWKGTVNTQSLTTHFYPAAFKVSCVHLLALQFSSDQSLSRVRLFETPWIAALQASLSITNSQSSLRLTSIESVMPSSPLSHPLSCVPFSSCPQSLPASESTWTDSASQWDHNLQWLSRLNKSGDFGMVWRFQLESQVLPLKILKWQIPPGCAIGEDFPHETVLGSQSQTQLNY